MKIQSISTQKHADGKSEMQLMTKISFLGELVLWWEHKMWILIDIAIKLHQLIMQFFWNGVFYVRRWHTTVSNILSFICINC